MNLKLKGSSSPIARTDSRAFRNATSGPFEFIAPLATTHFPKGSILTSLASNGGLVHSFSLNGCVSYMKYVSRVFAAPASYSA